MSVLKNGTLCVIVAGCPENIGLVVEVVEHIGYHPVCVDAYLICTVSGRDFPQLKEGAELRLEKGKTIYALTDRHKLRPLTGSELDEELRCESIDPELVTSSYTMVSPISC